MRYITQIISLAALVATTLFCGCTKDAEESFKSIENRALKAWMLKNRPELVDNFQEEGKYYVEVLEPGVADSMSIHDVVADKTQGSCWLFFDLTGRSLQGDVCLTRSEVIARMQGSFSRSTHYVPYLRFMGEDNVSLLEGTYLAMKNVLTLGEEYAAAKGLNTNFTMRYGTKLRLYLPSSIVGGKAGLSETGGYEGQYALDGNKPMIMDVEICDRVNNPLAYEGEMVEGFGEANGGVTPVKKDDAANKSALHSLTRSLGQHQTSGGSSEPEKLWRHVQDTIPGLILNSSYVPDASKPFDYEFRFVKNESGAVPTYAVNKPYKDTDIYKNGPAAIDKLIDEALLERFGEGRENGDLVGTDGSARIWYIGRFLDGFIFDTNIDEVKKIIYGKVEDEGTFISYSAATNKEDYITAWFYTIPELRYGSWATFVATSTFAYGVTGQSGSSTTTTTSTDMSGYYDYMNYMNYYNYYNTYYGNGYNNNYYMNYYNYANYYGTTSSDTSSSTTTKTTVSTEILPYTPLIFQVFIEEKASVVN